MAASHGDRAAAASGAASLALTFFACALLPLAACSSQSGEVRSTEGARGPLQRVVVLSPAAAEMLEALELSDRVVGVGEFGPWPPALTDLPRVGGYDAPSIERLLELDCALVLTARSDAAADAHRRMRALGIEVMELETGTYEGIFASLLQVGAHFDRQAAAEQIHSRLRDELAAIEARAAGLSPRRVLVVVGRDPLYVAGPGSHVDEMIRIAGGSNVAHDALSPYQQLSLEVVLERMPDVIIDAADNRPGALRGRAAGEWSQWEFLPAVQQRRVYHVDPGLLLIPGLRLPEMTLLTGRLIHPETFGEATEQAVSAADRDPAQGG